MFNAVTNTLNVDYFCSIDI